MLEVEQAVVQFTEHVAVDHVDLAVGSGETVAVLGPSGCGKTTLMRAIAGLQPLSSGRIRWRGADLTSVPPHERHFGLMFQEYALFPHRDVQRNVEFGLRMAAASKDARAARVDEILALVGLGELRARRVSTLSGGEQQRVALARALAVEPRLLMLDEPLGALDRSWRARLVDEIRALLGAAGLPAVYVTHDHEEAFAVAGRVAVMRSGVIVQLGTPAEVWRRPVDPWTAAFLGFGAATPGEARAGVLRTPWGELAVPAPDGPVQVVFRPDALRVDEHGVIAGTVTRATFVGPRVLLRVEVGAAPPLHVTVAQHDAPQERDRIRLAVDAEAVLVYPGVRT